LKSIDDGQSWLAKGSHTSQPLYYVVVGLNGNCIAVGQYVNIISGDYGETWTVIFEDEHSYYYGMVCFSGMEIPTDLLWGSRLVGKSDDQRNNYQF